MTKNDPVQLLINDGIATMTLNEPTKLNALSIPLIDNFMSITEQLRKNKSIRVLRITGTGKAFSAGADLNWMKRAANNDLHHNLVDARALAGIEWPSGLEVTHGAAVREDITSVTPCFVAVAESGGIVTLSGPGTPSTLNFVPDNHIVIDAHNCLPVNLQGDYAVPFVIFRKI